MSSGGSGLPSISAMSSSWSLMAKWPHSLRRRLAGRRLARGPFSEAIQHDRLGVCRPPRRVASHRPRLRAPVPSPEKARRPAIRCHSAGVSERSPMDPRPTERERKQELIVALSRSRESLGATRREFRQVKKRLNPVLRLRDAVRNHPLPVFGIAAGGALILTLVLRRPRAAKSPPPPSASCWVGPSRSPNRQPALGSSPRPKTTFSHSPSLLLPILSRFTVNSMAPEDHSNTDCCVAFLAPPSKIPMVFLLTTLTNSLDNERSHA